MYFILYSNYSVYILLEICVNIRILKTMRIEMNTHWLNLINRSMPKNWKCCKIWFSPLYVTILHFIFNDKNYLILIFLENNKRTLVSPENSDHLIFLFICNISVSDSCFVFLVINSYMIRTLSRRTVRLENLAWLDRMEIIIIWDWPCGCLKLLKISFQHADKFT